MIFRTTLPFFWAAWSFCLLQYACQSPPEPPIERRPLRSLSVAGGGSVGVYDFERFSPFLAAPNDTLYVLNFWATWCKPCVEELPVFEQLHQNSQGRKLRVILVSLDFVRQLETRLLPFLERRRLEPEVVVLDQTGANDWLERIDPRWEGSIPATLLYRGQKRAFYEGSFDWETLRAEVSKFEK